MALKGPQSHTITDYSVAKVDLAFDVWQEVDTRISGEIAAISGEQGHIHSNLNELHQLTDGDHDTRADNPHTVNKSQVGLSNVPNLDTTAAVSGEHTHTNKSELDKVTDGDHDVIATGNPHSVTKTEVGLGNVNDVQQIPLTYKGANNGVAELDIGGFVPLAQLPAAAKGSQVVADITERDAIISGERYEGLHALVLDATADGTVDSGGATYVLKSGLTNSDWEKTSEEESLDFDHSDFFHKPTDDTDDITEGNSKFVTQAQIDEFHTNHANRTQLDLISDGDHDAITTGNPHNVQTTQITDFAAGVSGTPEVTANRQHRQTVTGNPHDVKAVQISDFDAEVTNSPTTVLNSTHRTTVIGNPHDVKTTQISDFTAGVSGDAEVSLNRDHRNTISGNPHNVMAVEITDFDEEVENDPQVALNTAHRNTTDANPHDTKRDQITDFKHNIDSATHHGGVPGTASGELMIYRDDGLPRRSSVFTTDVALNSRLQTIGRNIMVNSLEVQALKETDINPDLSFFVDSFDDTDLLDGESSNYEVNEDEGFIGLAQGGALTAKDTTQTQFNQGSFISGEAFLDVGGDGAIRKEQLVAGGQVVQEDFEDIANVTTTGDAVQSQSGVAGTFSEGSNSLKIVLDFSGSSLSQSSTTTVDLGAGGVDISTAKFLNLSFLKTEESTLKYDIQIEDTLAATYTYAQADLDTAPAYQAFQKLISDITGIDKTSVRYVRFRIYEQTADQVILDVTGTGANHAPIDSDSDGEQTFEVTANTECQRLKIRVKFAHASDHPTDPLDVAVANSFNTTLGVATIDAVDVTNSYQDFYVTLDNPFHLTVGNTYKVLLQAVADSNKGYDIEYDNGSVYANGKWNDNASNDILFTLYTPAIAEPIYIDDLNIEAASDYEPTATFTSRGMNLGLVPNSLDTLYWTEDPNTFDTVQVRIRLAATEGGLTSASWSSYFSDPTGVGNSLVGITPNVWYQYEVSWTGGDGDDTDVVKEVNLNYSSPAGSGSATVISIVSNTTDVPTQFMMLWEDAVGTGTINYYISRDGKATWQSVLPSHEGIMTDFTSGSGTAIHVKAITTGNAKVYGWSVMTDEEFV